jgi:hypothetical protein
MNAPLFFIKFIIMRYLITTFLLLSFVIARSQQNLTKEIDPFNKIEVFGNIDVEMKLDNKETIKIKTHEIDPEKVTIKISDNILKISLISKLFDDDIKVKVYVTYKEIIEMRSDASAEIKLLDKIEGNKIVATAANGGRIIMKVKLDSVDLKLFQGGHIDISGTCKEQTSFVNTGSVLSASNFECDNVFIRMNTKANAEIIANKRIEAKVNSGSKLSFFGKPQEEILKTTLGGNNITKWNEH